MKKLLCLVMILLLLPAACLAETVVTSFYPIYLFALNLTEGLEGVTVANMAGVNTGCLHDYQLQTSDMKLLAKADLFLINGAGMENFLEDVTGTFPALPVVDASAGIELMAAESENETYDHDHDHEDEHHDHSHEYNAHVWLDAGNAQIMVSNLAQGLMDAMPDRADAIAANRDAYLQRLKTLDAQVTERLAKLERKDIITFHEAFPYFAQAYGLNVAAVVNREHDDALSPARLAELVGIVKELGVPPLFVEPQYKDLAATTIANETGAQIYTLDPIVTGPAEDVPLTYYEDVMLQNVQTLEAALGAAE